MLSLKLAASRSTGGIFGSTPVLKICSSTSKRTFTPISFISKPSSRYAVLAALCTLPNNFMSAIKGAACTSGRMTLSCFANCLNAISNCARTASSLRANTYSSMSRSTPLLFTFLKNDIARVCFAFNFGISSFKLSIVPSISSLLNNSKASVRCVASP